jgi:serine/threonine protein kinase
MINDASYAINLPGYLIKEIIHISARTIVYRGEQEQTNLPVAIKVLNSKYPQHRDLISLKNQFKGNRNFIKHL